MRRIRRLGWAAALLAATACSGGGDVLARFQPQIGNATDSFHFQVTGLNGVSATKEYTWTNTAQKVDVSPATQLTGGTATVTVYDAALTQVYAGKLAGNGTFESITGQPGAWRVRVELENASGTVSFRVAAHQVAPTTW
jgi:hypothetical protein